MPHLPDHRNHDPLLIAALAAGDAEGADLEQARDLVAACDECAALHHDLRAISAALPATPAPTRSRDFRLTPEQADSLRPAGWRRLLAPLAGPRFAFAAPLGGSLAALGIAGILVAGAASTPIANVAGERQAVSMPSAASPAFEIAQGAPSPAASMEPDRVLHAGRGVAGSRGGSAGDDRHGTGGERRRQAGPGRSHRRTSRHRPRRRQSMPARRSTRPRERSSRRCSRSCRPCSWRSGSCSSRCACGGRRLGSSG